MAPCVIFMNVGSMTAYQGLTGDTISGGGSWVQEHGFGHEIYNFQPHRGKYFGYGRPAKEAIALERLGAPAGSDHLDDVLVVWVAKSLVVGWYKGARLHRKCQPAPTRSKRHFRDDKCGFYAEAKVANCQLLHPDARTLAVPRAREVDGGMGRYVWYAEGPQHRPFLRQLFKLIESGGKVSTKNSTRKGRSGRGWQNDPRKRKLVEDAAIREVIRYYDSLGYTTRDRQNEHVGWDIEAEHNGIVLLLEVKGVSGPAASVELTSNEFVYMKKHRKNGYRICIVTDALAKKPSLGIYSYTPQLKRWEHHETGAPLTVEPVFVETARLHA